MKKIIAVLLLLTHYCYAQTDTTANHKWVFGANVCSNVGLYDEVGLDVFVKRGHHFFSIGQKFFTNHFSGNSHRYGFDIDYRFFFNKNAKRFRLFLPIHSDVGITNYTTSGTADLQAPYYGSYYEYKSKQVYFTLFTGIGIDVAIAQRLHLSSFIGAGYSLNKWNTDTTFPTNPALNLRRRDGFLDNAYWDPTINIGLGFDVVKKKETHT